MFSGSGGGWGERPSRGSHLYATSCIANCSRKRKILLFRQTSSHSHICAAHLVTRWIFFYFSVYHLPSQRRARRWWNKVTRHFNQVICLVTKPSRRKGLGCHAKITFFFKYSKPEKLWWRCHLTATTCDCCCFIQRNASKQFTMS